MSSETEFSYQRPNFWRKGNRISSVEDTVRVQIGGIYATDDKDKRRRTQSQQNRIVSTKYTLITFLPQNLFDQFRRIANFYFLIMTIIAMAIESPVSPLTSLIPLVFVICVTAAKQGYEDFLRYRADNMVNKSMVTVIRFGTEVDITCEDIEPGDLVRVGRDCDVPCDLVLLKSSDNGKCFITTANLDGETNLKTLTVPKGLPQYDVTKIHTMGIIECEQSHTDLYAFNGRLELPSTMNRISVIPTDETDFQADLHNVPLMAENLMLRGSRVKNTEWAIACAVYTGQNTKLALNSKITKNKISSSEQFINKYLAFFITLLLACVTVSYFMKRYFDLHHPEHNSYLRQIFNEYVVSEFLQDYFSFLILFNYLIPISLYVTVELQKFIGAFFLEWDPNLYDEETNQPFIVNTSDLNEELGQINILFSDKTGTLTKNIMTFKKCSINGKIYSQQGRGLQEVNRTHSLKIGECSKSVYTFFEALAVCHTVQVAGSYQEDEDRGEEEEQHNLLSFTGEIPPIFHKSMEELNDFEGVHEEIDFIETRQSVTFEHRNGSSKAANPRPLTDVVQKTKESLTHRRPSSLSNMNFVNTTETPETVKHVEFAKENLLLRKLKNQQYKRTVSNNLEMRTLTEKDSLKHRRTQSSIPFGAFAVPDSPTASFKLPNFERLTSVRTSSREYYAAPQYTEAQVVERQESMAHRKELETFIDILDYQASSPDEKALVEACAKLGIIFLNDNNDIYTLRLRLNRKKNSGLLGMQEEASGENNDIVQYKRLQVLEFTSDRKRMSVIVLDKFGQIWLYTKGAESHVLPLCSSKSANLAAQTQNHINIFAKSGLRTLILARRKLTKSEFISFNNQLIEANSSLTNRVGKVEICQRKIEMGLEILGATAVEDALQDDVRDTLVSIRAAGIKVWVLTGDKIETALNIALSCGHINENAQKYFIVECENELQLNSHLEAFARELKENLTGDFALLIDGKSLAIALQCAPEKFRDLAYKCHAVLCCRLSPLQKSEVVHLVRTSPAKPITCAIGDGANDVSMIQEAHVGLGIVGKEGRQAARCADYAFANFSMLKRVILLHGHYFSQRLALLVLYFFYKNVVFMGCQLFFQAHSLFSTQSIYDSLFLTLFNVSYSTLPILFISITEKVHKEEKLMSQPSLYKEITRNKLFGWRYFNGWMFVGLYHSIIVYFFAWFVWNENAAVYSEGRTVNFLCFGVFMVHNVVVLVNLKLLVEAIYKSYIFVATIWLSIFGFMGTTWIYNLFNAGYDSNLFMVYSNLLSSSFFWLLSCIIIVSALLPDLFFKALEALHFRFRTVFPGNEPMNTKKLGPKLIQTTYL